MGDITVLNDVVYGNHERQKLDIYLPENPKSEEGIILFIHGGGWNEGDKSGHHPDVEFYSRRGYISAAMNYRFVSDNITVFDELDDIAAALDAIKQECSGFGFSVNRVILSGGSAGGHLALLYAYTRMKSAKVKPIAACVYCPPVKCWSKDFLLGISGEFEDWKYDILSKCCGCRLTKETFMNYDEQNALKRMSAYEYVSAESVPTAIFHGKKDELVPFEHTFDILALLDKYKVKNDLLVYENSGHALDKDPQMKDASRAVIETYAGIYL